MRLLVGAELLSFDKLLELDEAFGGACMSKVTQKGTGQYDLDDRDVFRPLQYCATYFYHKDDMTKVEWFARHIVQMSGLHIETLLNRVGECMGCTLGHALNNKQVKRRIGPAAWELTDKFRPIYNAAKHDVTQDKDTHMFSVEDAVLAYFVSRKLGEAFYPLAQLQTDFG
jgi:hypothetical protein